MSRFSARSRRIQVLPCAVDKGCYRWVVTSSDDQREERSRFSYATASGARVVGAIRAVEIDAKV